MNDDAAYLHKRINNHHSLVASELILKFYIKLSLYPLTYMLIYQYIFIIKLPQKPFYKLVMLIIINKIKTLNY